MGTSELTPTKLAGWKYALSVAQDVSNEYVGFKDTISELSKTVTTTASKRLIDVTRFYVDCVNGSDDNSCTKEAPFKTMDKFFSLLNCGYNDIRCYILTPGDYTLSTVDSLSDCVLHISTHSSCSGQVQIHVSNGSGSIAFYNTHLNLNSENGTRLVFGIRKSSTGELGNIHCDNSLVTVQNTNLDCVQLKIYGSALMAKNATFQKLNAYNSKLRFSGTIASEYNGTGSTNIYLYNCDAYVLNGISAVARTVTVSDSEESAEDGTSEVINYAKFISLRHSRLCYGACLIPTNASNSLNFNYVADIRNSQVCGALMTGSYWSDSVAASTKGVYKSGSNLLVGESSLSLNDHQILTDSDNPTTSFSGNIKKNVSNSALALYGGENTTCANVVLRGSDSSSQPGTFDVIAKTSSANATLHGTPDGTLSWSGTSLTLGSTTLTETQIQSLLSLLETKQES